MPRRYLFHYSTIKNVLQSDLPYQRQQVPSPGAPKDVPCRISAMISAVRETVIPERLKNKLPSANATLPSRTARRELHQGYSSRTARSCHARSNGNPHGAAIRYSRVGLSNPSSRNRTRVAAPVAYHQLAISSFHRLRPPVSHREDRVCPLQHYYRRSPTASRLRMNCLQA